MDVVKIDINKIYSKEETLDMLNKRGQINAMIGDKNECKLLISAIYWIMEEK